MFRTRSMSIMEQLFGPDVSLVRKLLTLATFPIWGVLGIALLIFIAVGFFACAATAFVIEILHEVLSD